MIRWLSLFLGIYLFATSLAFGEASVAMSISDRAAAFALILLGLRRPGAIQLWGFVLVGLWLGIAPLLFWAKSESTYLNNTFCSLGAFALFLATPHPRSDSEPSIPPGWSYNPSSWPQRLPIAALALIGWMLSRYMAAFELGYIDAVWDPFFPGGTLEVITSKVSRSFPVPDAGLGALAYMLEMLSAFKGGTSRWRTMPWMVIVFGLLAIPLSLTSVLLILLQPLVVGAWCTWCLLTAACMLVLMALSLDEVTAAVQHLRRARGKPLLRLLLEGSECPGSSVDGRTPSLDASMATLLKASCWGVTLPWNLAVSMLLGAGLMLAPWALGVGGTLAGVDHVCGALVVVVSALSTAEVARAVRWINIALAAGVGVAGAALGETALVHACAAVGLALLAIRRGPVREQSGLRAD